MFDDSVLKSYLNSENIDFTNSGVITDLITPNLENNSQLLGISNTPQPEVIEAKASNLSQNLVEINELYGSSDLGILRSQPLSRDNYSLTTSDPSDIFKFSITEKRSINLYLHDISFGDDADLFLYQDNGNGIFDLNDTLLTSSQRGSNNDDQINWANATAGSYFAEVKRYNPGSSGNVFYDLDFAAVYNLGNLSSTPINRNNYSVTSSDPTDVFQFYVSGVNNINLTLNNISSASDADLRLYRDVNQNGLFDADDLVSGEITSSLRGSNQSEWISRTLETGNYFVQVEQYYSNPNYDLNLFALSDTGIGNLLEAAASDYNLSRNEMIGILQNAKDDNYLSSVELSELRTIVDFTQPFMEDYTFNLSNKIVNGNVANLNSGIGNLASGSTGIQMEQLIGKWFYGKDRPDLTFADLNNDGINDHTYRYASGNLFDTDAFGNIKIDANDVVQGGLGDCYFLATLASAAHEQQSFIENMFIDNLDGTFTVRFFNNGVADYVTVDRYLPTNSNGSFIYAGQEGGFLYNNSHNELWVALAEKAYAQINEQEWIGRRDNTNSYAAIEGGWMAPVIEQITGETAFSQSIALMSQQQLINLSNSNILLTAGFVSGGGFGVVNEHAYTITSYDQFSQTFRLHNPWGNHHVDVTWEQLNALQARIQWSNV